MTDPQEWITVAEASIRTGRSKRTIYEWIQRDLLATSYDKAGIVHVLSKAVVRTAVSMRRGRPRGTATRR